MKVTSVTNRNGLSFAVRLVETGDKYGRNLCLTHEETRPMVEFYDMRYPHTELGQFVSRYYADTLLNHGFRRGLDLDSGEPDWSVDGDAIVLVMRWLAEVTEYATN
jgi:hypothetical protein